MPDYKPPEPPKLAYSIKEACRVTSLSRSSIYRSIAAGLKTTRVGGRTLIPAAALRALINGER
jgi:excisionase family DNA binding protein